MKKRNWCLFYPNASYYSRHQLVTTNKCLLTQNQLNVTLKHLHATAAASTTGNDITTTIQV